MLNMHCTGGVFFANPLTFFAADEQKPQLVSTARQPHPHQLTTTTPVLSTKNILSPQLLFIK